MVVWMTIYRAAGPRLEQAGAVIGLCEPGDAMATQMEQSVSPWGYTAEKPVTILVWRRR